MESNARSPCAYPTANHEPDQSLLAALHLEEAPDHFWDLDESLAGFPVTIKRLAITMPLLKRLDEAQFVNGAPLQNQLGLAYEAISRKAIETAFGEESATVVTDNP
ncbi:MAG TPA: hypothetical protein G4N94_09115 [Caldilineae bacterium]|nr:hypothetical protein [Caldilineae bacterium]